jgi:pimeloyl-ACP methyl ester carboxylesterase
VVVRSLILLPVACAALLVSTTLAAQQVDIGPAPGRLIDVGGRKLHLDCSGPSQRTGPTASPQTGQSERTGPTVILEAGASSFAIDWSLVQPEIARSHRVCSYDRAGSGWSDPRTDVETPARIVADLHALLGAAGEKPPYVMIGASAGGLYVRQYQLDYPSEVVGLVLVDPATEDRLFTMYQQRAVLIGSLTAEQLASMQPTTPIPIPSRAPQTGPPFDRLPMDLYQLRMKIDQRLIASMPATVSPQIVLEASEGQRVGLARLLENRERADNPMRSIPVIVLTRGQNTGQGLAETHAGLARLSTNSRHEVVSTAGHEIHLFTPAAVIQAIQDVAVAATERRPLTVR